MSDTQEIRLTVEQQDDFAFLIHFEGTDLPELHTDEPEPLGAGSGPNPSQLLLAAVGNCLSASLLFALRKFKNDPGPLRARVLARLARNAQGRMRVSRIWVDLDLPEGSESYQQLERILAQFEAFCVVTESVRQGIDVEVTVRDAHGHVVLGNKSFEAGS